MENDTIQGYRLSPQQQRLWVLQQHTERSPYRVQVQVVIEGNVDPETLRKALQAVINRYEILNTTFQYLPGMSLPVQVINEPEAPLTQIYDLSHLSSSAQEIELNALFQQALERPFDLQQSPPIHLFFVKLGPDRQNIILSLPALCGDRPSLNRLVYELGQTVLKDDELPEPEMQFADLAEWQHELLESDNTKAGRDYWRKPKFFDAAQPELAFEEQRNEAGFQPKVWSIALSPQISALLKKLSREYEVTEAALLQSCWQIFLWRLTQSSDLIVATSSDGRTDSELKAVPGLLAKYLPVQLELHAGLSFPEVASQAHERLREADEWQEYFSFDQLLGSRGNQLRFFPFSFDYDEQQAEYVAGDIKFRITRLYDCIEPYKLKLSCWRQEGALIAELHYNSSLFNRDDIERLAGEFETIVKALFNHPEIAIEQAEILTSRERRQLLVEWNQTAVTYPEQCFHQMFEAQVEAHPNAIAVTYQDEGLSYRELNDRANQLAHYLQKLGIGPESRVGILLERSSEMVVAILGVLKAGGAYVPLDQSYPKERLQFLQDDGELTVLLTQTRLAETLTQSQAVVIHIDEARGQIEHESSSNPMSQVRPDNLAYVIYTSGSTGKPKGVMVPHYGLANYLNWCTRAYAVSEGQGSAVHSSISFDLTITSLFAPLAVGRSVMLIPEAEGIETLASALSTPNNFSLIKITPAHLELLSQLLPAEKPNGKTRALIIGGEELRSESLEFWRMHSPGTRLINEYGPTESVVGCCVYEVAEGDPASGPVPIGKPIANTELYIVDERMEPVPIGVAGELYIGGAGLARGYWRQPALTAEKFVPHPFSEQAGARLYRTGDLARYLADGRMEFLGRRDQQVKLRGYRIELGEIEAVLRSQRGVQDAVVAVQEGAGGEKRLVGYVVRAEEAAAVTMSEWRSQLSEQLPEYMIPAVVVELRELPLTANGKVDRRALPEPDGARPELGASYEAPRNEVEAELCRIWAAVLGLERVGIHDNFFELGGDSILSIQIVARANQKGLRLMPRQVFEQRTVAALATAVDTTSKVRTEQQSAEVLQEYAQSEQLLAQVEYWTMAERNDIKPLPLDGCETQPGAAAREVTVRLEREETQWLLTEMPKVTRAQVHEVLLTALGASLSAWSGAKRVLIDVESYVREEAIGAVGWSTVLYPLVVEVGEGSWSEKLRRVKEQQRQVPQGGIGYGVLRYLSNNGAVREQLARQPQAEVSFNYAGRDEMERPAGEGALVGPSAENRGAGTSPLGNRSHMLEVNASVDGDELLVHWTYNEGVHRQETIEQVAQQMLRAVKEIIQETRQSTTPLFSASDFPEAGLSQQELDNLMAVLE